MKPLASFLSGLFLFGALGLYAACPKPDDPPVPAALPDACPNWAVAVVDDGSGPKHGKVDLCTVETPAK